MKNGKKFKEKCVKPEPVKPSKDSASNLADESVFNGISTSASNPLKLVDYDDEIKSIMSENDPDLISLEKLKLLGTV